MFGRWNNLVIGFCLGFAIVSIRTGAFMGAYLALLVSIYTGVWHRLFEMVTRTTPDR